MKTFTFAVELEPYISQAIRISVDLIQFIFPDLPELILRSIWVSIVRLGPSSAIFTV